MSHPYQSTSCCSSSKSKNPGLEQPSELVAIRNHIHAPMQGGISLAFLKDRLLRIVRIYFLQLACHTIGMKVWATWAGFISFRKCSFISHQ